MIIYFLALLFFVGTIHALVFNMLRQDGSYMAIVLGISILISVLPLDCLIIEAALRGINVL